MTHGLFAAGDPDALGPYRLLGRLGGGGMGQVYLGRSPGGRLVAVKVIRPDLAADPEFRVRFAREVTNARNVSGAFTAAVIDADTSGPVPWLATAYVPGPSLWAAVRGSGPLPASSLLPLAAGLAEALVAIHAAGVVHRDLKPSNVLLAADGPRVIDFGISDAVEASTLTDPGAVMGSPGYMSPEQAEGRPAGQQSDVFSLAAVLTFAATGRGPFGSGPVATLIYRVITQPPDLASVPAELRPLIARCLAKSPDERPSPRELLAAWGEQAITAGWLPETVAGSLPDYEPAARAAALAAPQPPATAPPAAAPAAQPLQAQLAPAIDVPPRNGRATLAQPSSPEAGSRHARGSWRRRPWALAAAALAVAAVIAVVATMSAGALGRHPGAAAAPPGTTESGNSAAAQLPGPDHSSPSVPPPARGTGKEASRPSTSAGVKTPAAQPGNSPAPSTETTSAPAVPGPAAGSSSPAPRPSPASPAVTVSGLTEHSCSYVPPPAPSAPTGDTAAVIIKNGSSAEVDFYYLTGSAATLALTVPAGDDTAGSPYAGATYELERPDGSCIVELTTTSTSGGSIIIS